MHNDVLCLKEKTVFVCYNVILVKNYVDKQKKPTFVIIFDMTKFEIQRKQRAGLHLNALAFKHLLQ